MAENDISKWKTKMEITDSNLESIRRNLAENEEELLNEQSQEEHDHELPIKLFEMLDTVCDIHAAAQDFEPINDLLDTRKDELREQLSLLQRTLDLVALEDGGLSALQSNAGSAKKLSEDI